MADTPRSDEKPRSRQKTVVRTYQQGKRETADERRVRRLAVARDTQSDLKREAAERREAANAARP